MDRDGWSCSAGGTPKKSGATAGRLGARWSMPRYVGNGYAVGANCASSFFAIFFFGATPMS